MQYYTEINYMSQSQTFIDYDGPGGVLKWTNVLMMYLSATLHHSPNFI